MDIEEYRRQLLHDVAVLVAEIDAQERCIRRFRWRHPIKYWRWRKTPTGRQYKFMNDMESGKIPGVIS